MRGRIFQVNPEFPERELAGALLVVYEVEGGTIVGLPYSLLAFNDFAGALVRISRDQVADTGGELPWPPPEWIPAPPEPLRRGFIAVLPSGQEMPATRSVSAQGAMAKAMMMDVPPGCQIKPFSDDAAPGASHSEESSEPYPIGQATE